MPIANQVITDSFFNIYLLPNLSFGMKSFISLLPKSMDSFPVTNVQSSENKTILIDVRVKNCSGG